MNFLSRTAFIRPEHDRVFDRVVELLAAGETSGRHFDVRATAGHSVIQFDLEGKSKVLSSEILETGNGGADSVMLGFLGDNQGLISRDGGVCALADLEFAEVLLNFTVCPLVEPVLEIVEKQGAVYFGRGVHRRGGILGVNYGGLREIIKVSDCMIDFRAMDDMARTVSSDGAAALTRASATKKALALKRAGIFGDDATCT